MSLRRSFQQAVQDCNIRCLRLTSKWLNEHLLGMPYDDMDEQYVPCPTGNFTSREWDIIMFVNSILQAGEYQRAAQYLRNFLHQNRATSRSQVPLFLYIYALYMSGEKLKEQQVAEDGISTVSSSSTAHTASSPVKRNNGSNSKLPGNPCLGEIYNELNPKYVSTYDDSDHSIVNSSAEAMDPFVLYMYGVVVRDIRRYGGGSNNSVEFKQLNYQSTEGHGQSAVIPAAYSTESLCIVSSQLVLLVRACRCLFSRESTSSIP